MHNSRQLFALFVIAGCVAHVSAVSVVNAPAKTKKHKTPFIVPISPPEFGSTPTPPQKSSGEKSFARSPWLVLDDVNFEPIAWATRVDVSLPKSMDVSLVSQQWASQIRLRSNKDVSDPSIDIEKPIPDTQSRVVGVSSSPNATALSERITVHNLNVAAMEDQLRLRDSWTLEEIESAYEQLTSIQENLRIWTMYFDLLEPRKQRRMRSPASLSKAKELLHQRVFETQVALEINQFAVTKLKMEDARARLEELNELLQH